MHPVIELLLALAVVGLVIALILQGRRRAGQSALFERHPPRDDAVSGRDPFDGGRPIASRSARRPGHYSDVVKVVVGTISTIVPGLLFACIYAWNNWANAALWSVGCLAAGALTGFIFAVPK